MRTNDDRFRFIAQFHLHVTWHSDHDVSLMWRAKSENWEGSPPYFPVSSGKTLEEAADEAIDRWEKKYGKRWV
ncbi:MAG: hypothetical protein JWL97_2956 [Gemmatimonadales bacterium]|nr:hypothetical protein [Gemmatimonadales bacterium]